MVRTIASMSTTLVGEFVYVARDDQMQEGSMLGVTVRNTPILLSKIGGKIYAMDAVCSHFYGYLPRGELRDHVVVCPVHWAQYDIGTGKVIKNVNPLVKLATRRKATDLRIYEVEVVDHDVRVKV
jgi:nitrite reductase/ring-hydroxylating ferredoxin subunit